MAYRYNPNNKDNKEKDFIMNKNLPWICLFLGIFTGMGFLVPISIFWLIYQNKHQDDVVEKTTYKRQYSSNNTSTNTTKNTKVELVKLTSKQMKLIDERLADYFERHGELPVINDINLRLKNQNYHTLNSLNVFKSNDYVCSLAEFGYKYPQMYNQILRLLLNFANDDNPPYSNEVKKASVKKETKQSVKEKCAKDFIKQIDDLNTEIPDEEISNGLYESCALLKQISLVEEKFPDNKPKLKKLYEYYLPILINILTQYKDLQLANSSDNLAKTKDKLHKSIILINDAMKTIISTLCEDDMINLSADISTLEAILKKDGLAGDDMMKMKAGDN